MLRCTAEAGWRLMAHHKSRFCSVCRTGDFGGSVREADDEETNQYCVRFLSIPAHHSSSRLNPTKSTAGGVSPPEAIQMYNSSPF